MHAEDAQRIITEIKDANIGDIEDRVKLSLGGMSIMENRRSLGLV